MTLTVRKLRKTYTMKSKLLHDAAGARTYAVILETGDEVISCLTGFAKEADLDAATFKAIGAFSQAELAYFEWKTKQYRPIPIIEQVEVASLTGDVAIDPDGQPAVHVHAVLGKRDGTAAAGHLKAALVRPTLEIILTESLSYLRKVFDPAIGISLIDPKL